MKVCLTGGGTAGHVYPGLAIARELAKDPECRLLYIGTRGRSEELILAREEQVSGPGRIPIRFATSRGYPGASPLPLLRFLLTLKLGVFQAAFHLLRFRPDLLIACGGYASAPAVFAAWGLRRIGLLRTRILLHEQNALPGLMNRVSARLADLCALTFAESARGLRTRRICHTGYPVRPDLTRLPDKQDSRRGSGLPLDGPVLLVFGGSQGARSLNRALYELLAELLERGIAVIHAYGTAAGPEYHAAREHATAMEGLAARLDKRVLSRYHAEPFLFDMPGAYAAADLCLTRAGAGTIFELLCAGLPAVLVPKMGLPGDHQVCNARIVEEHNAAVIVLEEPRATGKGLQEHLSPAKLRQALEPLLASGGERRALQKEGRSLRRDEALQTLLRLARELAQQKEPACDPPADPAGNGPGLDSRTCEQLLALVQKGTPLDGADARYLAYRCGAALVSGSWLTQNCGVKLAGELRDPAFAPLLVCLMRQATPAKGLRRLAGEPRGPRGFVRRNCAISLRRMCAGDPESLALLQELLQDSYWEVRVEALRALTELLPDGQGLPEAVIGKLKHGANFEERIALLWYYGRYGNPLDWRKELLPGLEDGNSRVRECAIRVMTKMLEEGRLRADEELLALQEQIMLTSTRFHPVFPLKQRMRELSRSLRENTPC